MAKAYAPTTKKAVFFAEGDRDYILQAGGEVVGTIEAWGNSFATHEGMAAEAQDAGAMQGGTHIMIAAEGTTTGAFVYSTNYGTQGGTYSKPRSGFVVVRVPPEHWSELPPPLRPSPLNPSTGDAPSASVQASSP